MDRSQRWINPFSEPGKVGGLRLKKYASPNERGLQALLCLCETWAGFIDLTGRCYPGSADLSPAHGSTEMRMKGASP